MGQDNCDEVIHNVYRLLDGDMNADEEKTFISHVEGCPKCLEHYHIEKAFKQFVCNKLNRKTIEPSLIETIKVQISQMDSGKALIFVLTVARLISL